MRLLSFSALGLLSELRKLNVSTLSDWVQQGRRTGPTIVRKNLQLRKIGQIYNFDFPENVEAEMLKKSPSWPSPGVKTGIVYRSRVG